jgi:hypothetical protein
MSGFQDYIDEIQSVSSGQGYGNTRFLDGRSMSLTQALQYVNQVRASNPQKYQELISIMNAAGYTIPKTQNPQTVVSRWDTFVRDLFVSEDQDVFSFVAKRRADSSGDGTSVAEYPSLTDQATAAFNLQTAFRDYLGVSASNKDIKQYYKALSKLESSRPTRQVTRRVGNRTVQTTVGGVTQEEKEDLLLQFVSKKAAGTNLENITGALGTSMQSIRNFASSMGVVLSDSDMRQLAVSAASGTPLDSINQRISTIAKAKFPGLTNFIDQGLRVKDIANQYIAEKADMLELNVNQIDLTDKDVYGALAGNQLESIGDFRRRMRENPIFQYTGRAREEMSGFIEETLQRFGLV